MCAQKDFSVTIVGGGIAGLVCAIALGRAGVQVDIFEAALKYGEIGAGIGIGPNAMRVLEAMGILDDIVARSDGSGPKMWVFRFTRGVEPYDTIYDYLLNDDQNMGIALHRATFLDALAHSLPKDGTVRSHFSKRCITVSETPENGRTRISFADGTDHETDILIGADGIKSLVRTQVFGTSDERLVDTRSKAYRALVPVDRLLEAGVKEELLRPWPRCWTGPDKHIITYPIKNGTLLNIAAIATDFSSPMVPAGSQSSWSSWLSPTTRTEFVEAFDDCGDMVKKMLNCVEQPSKWSIHGIYPPLETFVSTTSGHSVALVGDAAHAMLPHLAAGAGTGIEDAFVLARLLAHPQTKRDNLAHVLRAYDAVRVPRATFAANASKRAGDVYEGHGPSGASDDGMRRDLNGQWAAIWGYDACNDIAKAVQTLEEDGVF